MLLDQFTVTFDAELVTVEKIQRTVEDLGFKPRLAKVSNEKPAKAGEMTPPVKIALAQALEHDQLVFVKFSAHWCGPCQKMSKVTYSDAGVVDALSQFIVVEIDVDKDAATARSLRVGGVPTFIVLNPQGSILTRVEGFKNPNEFLEAINY